jgi:hypothetical protein
MRLSYRLKQAVQLISRIPDDSQPDFTALKEDRPMSRRHLPFATAFLDGSALQNEFGPGEHDDARSTWEPVSCHAQSMRERQAVLRWRVPAPAYHPSGRPPCRESPGSAQSAQHPVSVFAQILAHNVLGRSPIRSARPRSKQISAPSPEGVPLPHPACSQEFPYSCLPAEMIHLRRKKTPAL